MDMMKEKKEARHFAEVWRGKGYEKGDSQKFWIQLLGEVLGVERPTEFVEFEAQVKLDHTSFIDVMIPATHVLIEQKGLHRDLNEKIKQSDGTFLTPKQQVQRYSAALPYSMRPRWIVTCNFKEFHVYDMEHPQDDPAVILLENLPKEYYRLHFLVSTQSETLKEEMEISLKAGDLVGRLYDALLPRYLDPTSEKSQQSLNKLCVRLVFCLYAEDAGLFGTHTAFHDYLAAYPAAKIRAALIDLFRVLNAPLAERDPYLDADLAAFPYVNGGLFAGEIEIPQFTDEIKALILHEGSEDFDWSKISPTIFGAVFESTLNPETRRKGGMHYTSIENIHKVIDPLFMDDLKGEFHEIKAQKVTNARKRKLEAFQEKLAKLRFFDPACGSGNFLTESYISLRRLENEVIKEMQGAQIVMGALDNPIRVSIGQFSGIEINDFAVTVARTALWIAESQMMEETLAIVEFHGDFLPLKTSANIVEGNALRLDWRTIVPPQCTQETYIMGNPPFVGYSNQSKEQKADMLSIYVDEKGKPYKTAGKIDYVAGWYFKAAELMHGTEIRAAFVSTNSITQGEQVAGVWKPLYERFGVHIDFAHRTFRWDSESTQKAHVHCVIVGFSTAPNDKPRLLFSGNTIKEVDNINFYLLHAKNIFIQNHKKPLSNVPEMLSGNRPADGGHLILDEQEKVTLLDKEPQAAKYVKRFMMGREFINNIPRYCLWLVGASPAELKKLPMVRARIEACRTDRLNSPDTGRRKLADTPTLFREQINPKNFIAVPKVSSERRRYVPIGYLDDTVIAGDKLFMIPDANLYHFGVLTSNVHMAWMRAVTGRLKSDYSYSKDIVYNDFPWPMPTDAQRAEIEAAAQGILDARAAFPDASLADLYDEALMPPALRKAHQANDRAVMRSYGFPVKTFTETDCVAALMRLYQDLTAK